jgi:hypothetical protein
MQLTHAASKAYPCILQLGQHSTNLVLTISCTPCSHHKQHFLHQYIACVCATSGLTLCCVCSVHVCVSRQVPRLPGQAVLPGSGGSAGRLRRPRIPRWVHSCCWGVTRVCPGYAASRRAKHVRQNYGSRLCADLALSGSCFCVALGATF